MIYRLRWQEDFVLVFQKEVGAFQKCVRPKATAHLWGSWDSLSLAQQSKMRK